MAVSVKKPKAKAPKKAAASKAAPKKMTQTTLTSKPPAKSTAAKKRAKPDSEDEPSEDDIMSIDGDSVLSSTPPKKAKKPAPAKKGGSKPLADVQNESFGVDGASESQTNATDASERFQRVSGRL